MAYGHRFEDFYTSWQYRSRQCKHLFRCLYVPEACFQVLDLNSSEQIEWLSSVDPKSVTCLLAPVWHEEADVRDWFLHGMCIAQPALVLAHTLQANSLVHTDTSYITSAVQETPPISDSILHAKAYSILTHGQNK